MKRKCVTLSNFKLLLLRFFLFQLLSKIDICKSRIENLKEVNTGEFLCLHSIRSMELSEKTELLRRLFVYTLSKIHLDSIGLFVKFFLGYKSQSGSVHEIKDENQLHIFPFHDCSFSEDRFYYSVNSLSKNVSRNDWDVFRKRGMHFIHLNINSLLPKIDEVHYIPNITNASIIGISETLLDETTFVSKSEVHGYDFEVSIAQGEVVLLLVTLKVRLHIVTAQLLQQHRKYFFDIFCLNINQSYWVSYIDHPINTLIDNA